MDNNLAGEPTMTPSSITQFPLEPARDLVMPHAWDLGFLIFAGSVLALFILFGLWQLAVKREPLMLFLLIGGLAGEMLEPICNVLGMAYHPEHGQIVGFTTLGRHIPLWLVTCYPWYFGAFSYSLIQWDSAGTLTPKRYWSALATAAFFCFFIEIFPVRAVLWQYFGPQPLMFAGMPLMWYVVNPTSDIATAAFLTLAVRQRTGWQRWILLALMPVCIVGFHTGAFAPVYVTENAGWSADASIVTALLSTICCVILLRTLGNMLFAERAERAVATGTAAAAGAARAVAARPPAAVGPSEGLRT
jgi:hypothetical protein